MYLFLFLSLIWCLIYAHKGCFNFIIQSFNRNVTNVTKINIVAI